MLPEDTRGNQGFQFSTPAMAAERAASELRYGRPVIVKGPKVLLATLALDADSPSTYEQFAVVARGCHTLFLTAHRAVHLGVQAGHDIAVPLVGVNFNWASRLSYAAMAMLRLLNITRVNLLTNNPAKIAALVDNGIIVDGRTAVIGRVTPENKNYLKTKRNRAGHLLDIETLMSRS